MDGLPDGPNGAMRVAGGPPGLHLQNKQPQTVQRCKTTTKSHNTTTERQNDHKEMQNNEKDAKLPQRHRKTTKMQKIQNKNKMSTEIKKKKIT